MVSETEVAAMLPAEKAHWLRQYVLHQYFETDAHLLFALIGGLIDLAATVPTNLQLPGVAGGPVKPNIFALVVGRSGDRKTTAVKNARVALQRAYPSGVSNGLPVSAEKLISEVVERPTRAVMLPEFGEVLAKAQGSGNYFAKVKPTLTNLYDCEPVELRSKAGNAKSAPDPRLSLFAAIAPSLLQAHSEPQDWTGGFFSRFLTVFATPERRIWLTDDDQAKKEEQAQRMDKLVRGLKARSKLGRAGICKGFNPAAAERYVEWAEQKFHENALGEGFAGQSSRMAPMACKVALLYAWGDPELAVSGTDWYLGLEQLEPAIRLMEVHEASLRHIAGMLEPNLEMRYRRACLEQLSYERAIPVSQIIRETKIGFKRRIVEALETLVAARQARRCGTDRDDPMYLRVNPEDPVPLVREGTVLRIATGNGED